MKKKKGIIVGVILTILVIATAIFLIVKLKKDKDETSNDELVYTELVSNLTDSGYSGDNRYMGVVESQEVKGVDKDSEKKVGEILVSEGDIVSEGDPLFNYDTDELTLQLRQMELELTSIYNSISNANAEITKLSQERNDAEAEDKIQFTAQIQSLQAQVNQYSYDASSKQLEIDRQKSAIENNVVFAPMSGVIKEINENTTNTSQDDNYYGGNTEQKHFISIMALGDYRIKATASEMNVRSMYEGQPMIVRSRLDESITWTGVISKIDLEHPESNNNNDFYYMGGSQEQATKYPFYISLDSVDNLMLGQHVYVEADYGQSTVKTGIWLNEYYIMQEDGKAYIWVENKKGRVEKREVILGGYDDNMWSYEIVEGLSKEDYIAFPEERIKDGMRATHNYEDIMQQEMENMMTDDGMMVDDGMSIDDMGITLPDGYTFNDNGELIDADGNVVNDFYFDENGNIQLGTPDETVDGGGSEL